MLNLQFKSEWSPISKQKYCLNPTNTYNFSKNDHLSSMPFPGLVYLFRLVIFRYLSLPKGAPIIKGFH